MIIMMEINLHRNDHLRPLRGNKHCSRAPIPDFLSDKKITGGFAYKPGDQQCWHTNHEGGHSARCYLVWSETGESGMRFIIDGEIKTFKDVAGWQYRIFNVPQPHCVYAECNRISYGWRLPVTNEQIFNPISLEHAEDILQIT